MRTARKSGPPALLPEPAEASAPRVRCDSIRDDEIDDAGCATRALAGSEGRRYGNKPGKCQKRPRGGPRCREGRPENGAAERTLPARGCAGNDLLRPEGHRG